MSKRPAELDDADRQYTGYTRGPINFGTTSTSDIDITSCGIVFFDMPPRELCRHSPTYKCPKCGGPE